MMAVELADEPLRDDLIRLSPWHRPQLWTLSVAFPVVNCFCWVPWRSPRGLCGSAPSPEVDEEAFTSVRVVEVGIKPNGLSRSQAMKIEAHIARKRARVEQRLPLAVVQYSRLV